MCERETNMGLPLWQATQGVLESESRSVVPGLHSKALHPPTLLIAE